MKPGRSGIGSAGHYLLFTTSILFSSQLVFATGCSSKIGENESSLPESQAETEAIGSPDLCDDYCELVDRCPCFKPNACISDCAPSCDNSGVAAEEAGCTMEHREFMNCALAVTNECSTGYIEDAFEGQCLQEIIARNECLPAGAYDD